MFFFPVVVVQPYEVGKLNDWKSRTVCFEPPSASAKDSQSLFVPAERLSSNTLSCKASAEEDRQPIAKVILSPYYLSDPTVALRCDAMQ